MLRGKTLQHCVLDLPTGLSTATLSAWFKTLMAELLHQWQELASLTATLSKAHRLSSSSAHTVGKLMGLWTRPLIAALLNEHKSG